VETSKVVPSKYQELFNDLASRGWTVKGLTARTTDLTLIDYHKLPGYSSSMIREIDRSPLHARTSKDTFVPSPATDLGTAFHAAWLEQELFQKHYIPCPAEYSDRRKKDYKDWAKLQDPAKEILPYKTSIDIHGMMEAAKQNKAICDLTKRSIVEESIFWIDQKTGLLCKSRADMVSEGKGEIVTDIKTTRDASFYKFRKSYEDMKYYVQAAMQREAVAITRGPAKRTNYVFAIESSAPYGNTLYPVDEEYMQLGHRLLRAALSRIAECEAINIWPGYDEITEHGLYPSSWLK